jgi:superfamily I DNA/RNA helicase
LFRTNQQSRPIETELRKANVRYHLIGGQSFFDRREIKDFIAFLKTFLNPHDDISLLRIANVPARGLSDVTMERLLGASHERGCSVFTAMKNPLVTTTFQKNTRECIEALVTFIEKTQAQLQSAGGLTLPAWAENFLNETGYFAELHRAEKNPEVSEARVRNLRELVATMNGSAPTLAEQLDDFLENITLDSDREEEKENTADAVTLITMHSCKGLEFPHVYIVGLEDGLLPHTRSKVEGTMDEERRLFYVAVTRAMLTLTISHCAGRKKYGQLLPCQPSPFLKELPEELVETSDSKSKTPVAQESGKNLFAAMREAANK